MKKMLFWLACLPAFAFSATIEVQQFDSPQQEQDYRALIAELRCPQCQNNNIADSNATIATDMRHKTLELLKQGKSKSEVVDYMVERYGNFVTYNPPLTPATLLLWALPLLLVLGSVGVIWVRRKKGGQTNNATTPSSAQFFSPQLSKAEQERLHQILNDKE